MPVQRHSTWQSGPPWGMSHAHPSELWPRHLAKVRHAALSSQGTVSSLGTTCIQRTVQTKGTDIFSGRRPARLGQSDLLSILGSTACASTALGNLSVGTRLRASALSQPAGLLKEAGSLEAAASVRETSRQPHSDWSVPRQKHYDPSAKLQKGHPL